MAMDKEYLLSCLQEKYLTRQEVMYKLPLNISINSFWNELLDRRKMKSVMLPLHRGDGKPYWYVLTDKMIEASEKLCSLALKSDMGIDPYRSGITKAMTEEVFFTSYVEGANISLQEAMTFLERGTEPENVQEQMILNNKNAWTDMNKMLFYPMDERMVRMLAFRLTEEMDNQAAEYRQTDEHTIAAMGAESCDVPRAAAIPGLMQELYAFLANPDIHPLIKAAAGQAYILTTRPFPEGNERLSRMISYAVLLRSGYDFFRDISISRAIASESFRYYKAMQDILRNENDCDLTYFMDYYLDLLARVTDMKEPKMLRDTIEMEREAAKTPLAKNEERGDTPLQGEEFCGQEQDGVRDTVTITEYDDTWNGDTIELMSKEEFLALLERKEKELVGPYVAERMKRISKVLKKLLAEDKLQFSRYDWQSITGLSKSAYTKELRVMKQEGLILDNPNDKCGLEKHIIPVKKNNIPSVKVTPERRALINTLQKMLESTHEKEKKLAKCLLNLIGNEIWEFQRKEFMQNNPGMDKEQASKMLYIAKDLGILSACGSVYHFEKEPNKAKQRIDLSEKERNLLLKLMTYFPNEKFTYQQAREKIEQNSSNALFYYLTRFVNRGILTKERKTLRVYWYSLSTEVHGIFNAAGEQGGQAKFVHAQATEKRVFEDAADVG